MAQTQKNVKPIAAWVWIITLLLLLTIIAASAWHYCKDSTGNPNTMTKPVTMCGIKV